MGTDKSRLTHHLLQIDCGTLRQGSVYIPSIIFSDSLCFHTGMDFENNATIQVRQHCMTSFQHGTSTFLQRL